MKRKTLVFLILLFFVGFACVLPNAVPEFGATAAPVYILLLAVCVAGVVGSCVGLVRCGPALQCPNCKEPIVHKTVRTPIGGKPITSKDAVCCPNCGAIVYLYDCHAED